MKVLVIDGQGGRIGSLIVQSIIKENLDIELVTVGTNAIATSEMIKAGSKNAATGENPVLFQLRDSDIIIGPIGIIAANSLLGEITPKMAEEISSSPSLKLLLPVSHCKNQVVGIKDQTMTELIKEVIIKLKENVK